MFTGCSLKSKNPQQIIKVFNFKCFATIVTFVIVDYKLYDFVCL